jgi:hypothetical protein
VGRLIRRGSELSVCRFIALHHGSGLPQGVQNHDPKFKRQLPL